MGSLFQKEVSSQSPFDGVPLQTSIIVGTKDALSHPHRRGALSLTRRGHKMFVHIVLVM